MGRVRIGGIVYHVLNRSTAGMRLFAENGDYAGFEKVLREAHEQVPMRTIAYCLMPNHWHMVLWPVRDGELSSFMHWLMGTHTKRWHAAHDTTGTGHIYQGRFKSFPVEDDRHYLTVCRYVDRNALRAGLVSRAEDWRWGSLWRRTSGDPEQKAMLSDGPREWPDRWLDMVNTDQADDALNGIRTCIKRSRPYGSNHWVQQTCDRLGLPSRPPGRPKKLC